jgi:hypothetical protein
VRQEVSDAFKHYLEVRAQAFLEIDSSSLNEVADGDALADLQQQVEDERMQGRALDQDLQYQFEVLAIQGDEVVVAARFQDSSVWVDPQTHDPLAGEVKPASPDQAPLVLAQFYLKQIDGTWKVVRAERQA